jgi:hypothetical protein
MKRKLTMSKDHGWMSIPGFFVTSRWAFSRS